MSTGIVVPNGFWPRPGETFECELTRVERFNTIAGSVFRSVPSGRRVVKTLERYCTYSDGMLCWLTRWSDDVPPVLNYALGAMSRFGWDAARHCTYTIPLPYWVLISAFERWHPDFAAAAVGLPTGTFPDLDYPDRYPRWCAIYLDRQNSARPANIPPTPANTP